MSISFNHIASDIRVPLFYAEMDHSRANTAQESQRGPYCSVTPCPTPR